MAEEGLREVGCRCIEHSSQQRSQTEKEDIQTELMSTNDKYCFTENGLIKTHLTDSFPCCRTHMKLQVARSLEQLSAFGIYIDQRRRYATHEYTHTSSLSGS